MSLNVYSSTIPHRYRNRFLRDGGSNVSLIGGGSSSSSSSGGGGSGFNFEPHYFWGQYFDDTQDVSGDLTGVGSITASGVINASGITLSDFVISPTVSGTNAVFDNGTFYSGITSNGVTAQTISGNSIIGNNIRGNNISGTNASITSLTATAITSNTINVTNKLTTNQLEAVSGYIKTLLSDEITVDYLTVTKAAHFFKLIIDEIKATQGQLIITPCNAVLDKVETVNGNYRCYFRAKDEDREIYNNFEVNDQVVCQTFNVATGVSYNVSNTYYWRLCVGTGTTSTTIDGETVECHYIDLSNTDKDSYSNSAPAKGDNVVQLGNRNDSNRQAAIIISAYNQQFLDPTIKAPSIVQYHGINDYSLQNHRRNIISKDLNKFVGDFNTTSGIDLEDGISTIEQNLSSITLTVASIENDVSGNTQNISQLQQTSTSLTSTVQSLQNTVSGNTQNISQLQQTSTSLTSTVQALQNTVSQIELTKKVTIDATNLSESYAYPVVIALGGDNPAKPIRCNVSRTLVNSYGVPSYATHSNGFVIDVDWTTKASGWGTNRVNDYWSENDNTRFINDYKVNWVTSDDIRIVGSIGQVTEVSQEIVYVRGGSKYDISTSKSDATITLYSNGYNWSSNGYSQSRPVINISSLVIPIQDTKTYSEIVQTATNIELNVYDELKNKTGINVSAGTITLDADNTTIVGNLNITDTNNGITVFDNDSFGRIYLQPKDLNADSILNSGTIQYYNQSYQAAGGTSLNQSFTQSIGTLTKNQMIKVSNVFANTMYYTGSTNYSFYDIKAQIEVLKGSTVVKTVSNINLDEYGKGAYYYTNTVSSLMYTCSADSASYSVRIRISSNTTKPTSYYTMCNVSFKVQTGYKVQTYIGNDGLYTHSAPNTHFIVDKNKFELRNEFSGLRFLNGTGNTINSSQLQVIAGLSGTVPNYKPLWLSFYNYTPIYSIGSLPRYWVYNSVTNIGSSKYVYTIDAVNDYGICYINYPAYNSSGNKVSETWVQLPNTSFTDNDGNVCQLPVGYTVTIINNLYGDNYAEVYVTPKTSYANAGMIIDANRDVQSYVSLNGVQCSDTYIYLGTYSNGTQNVAYWRSLHDTQ